MTVAKFDSTCLQPQKEAEGLVQGHRPLHKSKASLGNRDSTSRREPKYGM